MSNNVAAVLADVLIRSWDELPVSLHGWRYRMADYALAALTAAGIRCLYVPEPPQQTCNCMEPGDPLPEHIDWCNSLKKSVEIEHGARLEQVGWYCGVTHRPAETGHGTVTGTLAFIEEDRCCEQGYRPAYAIEATP